ncbi:hypothetical protein [Actinoplanes sp. NPDC020271]|uniref:hypothetical protein n=1 Tax=Actinoplanes sp. NPDC020271 TaxID=3363896 RepID=UPI00379B7E26
MNANDTADRETPAARATSVEVVLPVFAGLVAAWVASLLEVLTILAAARFARFRGPSVGASTSLFDGIRAPQIRRPP